jgi:hypothetical protein
MFFPDRTSVGDGKRNSNDPASGTQRSAYTQWQQEGHEATGHKERCGRPGGSYNSVHLDPENPCPQLNTACHRPQEDVEEALNGASLGAERLLIW